MAFEGVTVYLANEFSIEASMILRKVIEKNGGKMHDHYDPSRNGLQDYHVIGSKEHDQEAFVELKKGSCQILGLQCILRCAKDKLKLPSYKSFTCCFALEGIRVFGSGFDSKERVEINELVSEMSGSHYTYPSVHVDIVIVKNVLAPYYKWAVNCLKKPVVTYKWLEKCSAVHDYVHPEQYAVPPFSGLTICVTGFRGEKRKAMEKLVSEHGGQLSSCLTNQCTHLICEAPEGTKYNVAKRWGHIIIVTMQWFEQSIANKACMDEKYYPVEGRSLSSCMPDLTVQDSQEKNISQPFAKCCFSFVGFEDSEMKNLANMVLKGGGSQNTSSNHRTHIVLGNPSEEQMKDLRKIAVLDAESVYFVKTSWLKECVRQKKQVSILPQDSALDLLYPNEEVTGVVPGNVVTFDKASDRTMPHTQPPASNVHVKSTNVFEGKTFCFSNLFPKEMRAEIANLVAQGGGTIISGQEKQIHYTIEGHGLKTRSTRDDKSICISYHWIQFCLKDECLLEVDSNVLYSPLPCTVPLPGFDSLRFCVSQYEKKDKILLGNLCEVLGATFSKKLTKNVTHLLCKFTSGQKYKTSCELGINTVTSEWIFGCVKQNAVISVENFLPKKVPSQIVPPGSEDAPKATRAVPPISTKIGELLELTSKMHDRSSPRNTGYQRTIYSSGCSGTGKHDSNPRTVLGISNQALNRNNDNADMYDGFCSRTESQVVGYEVDYTGRQKLIDKAKQNKSLK